MGRTIDASDSTVFFSTKALFNHLARHPRPLPEVPGIVVVDQAEIPPELHNDYDLHFKQPPVEHPVLEHEEEISTLPTAYTREPTRRMYGQRLLGDKTPALEMVTGAHVTGLTWPAKYMGEWAFGWHDGIYASVPTDAIKLEPPPVREIKLGGTSNVRAKAQWKFSHKDSGKDKTNWLKFDKNDVITNISCKLFSGWGCGICNEYNRYTNMLFRAIPRTLVLVRHQLQGQMGHLPPGIHRHKHCSGAVGGGIRSCE